MELCGCELYGRLCERKVYRERDAADVMLQMLQAVSYLHSHRIVHRDLKLENWMYGEAEGDDRLRLIDFGFSRILDCAEETLDMPCGTLHYTSPEVLSRKYTSQCDMWSLGVICYMLLIGRPPFTGTNNLKIARAIIHGEFARDGRWDSLSANARDLLQQLLQKNASLRLDATRALAHPWITGAGGGPCDIGVDVLRSLRKFAKGSHLRRAALTVLAYSLTSRELQDLEKTFLAFDRTGRGTITLDQLAEAMHTHLEVSSQEVQRIFESFDFAANDEELHYTPFIAALLATRVKLHEDKVRAAFEAFDRDGTGFITAESLRGMYRDLQGPGGPGGMSREEAEKWIREVDYNGNGVIGYDEFFAALVGKNLWALPALDEAGDTPTVRIYDGSCPEGRPRGLSESFASKITDASACAQLRHKVAYAIIDSDLEERRTQSFTHGLRNEPELQFRTVSCGIDEQYFS